MLQSQSRLEAWREFLTGRIAQEKEDFDAALSSFNSTLQLDPNHAYAMVTRACVLARLDRMEESMAAFDSVFERFRGSDDTNLRDRAAAALNNKAFHLLSKKQFNLAIFAYDALIDAFGADSTALLQQRVAAARVGREFAIRLEQRSRVDQTPRLV